MKKEDISTLLFYASTSSDFLVRTRCHAVALILEGWPKIDVAEELKCSRTSLNAWMNIYENHGVPGLLMINTGGRHPIIAQKNHDSVKTTLLKTQKEESPARGYKLRDTLEKIGFKLGLASVYNLLHRLKLSFQTPRPVHPKRDEKKVKEWLTNLPGDIQKISDAHPDKNIEIYFGDETRFGQQGILVRQWSEIGKRPIRERQIEYKNAWIFGAVNPNSGAHHGIVTSHAASDFMQKFIDSFSSSLNKNVHVVLILDNATWHHSSTVTTPSNITLHFLPPYSPELNPSERLWLYIKSNFLCNKLYKDSEEIIETGVTAWQKITTKIIRSVCACDFISNCVSRGF